MIFGYVFWLMIAEKNKYPKIEMQFRLNAKVLFTGSVQISNVERFFGIFGVR